MGWHQAHIAEDDYELLTHLPFFFKTILRVKAHCKLFSFDQTNLTFKVIEPRHVHVNIQKLCTENLF